VNCMLAVLAANVASVTVASLLCLLLQMPSGPAGSFVQSSMARSRTAVGGFRPSESSSAKIEGKLHAAAEVRVSRLVEPKVFVPHERRPGLPPRKVEVERKKRLYAAQVCALCACAMASLTNVACPRLVACLC
jgi:hypothetical protein